MGFGLFDILILIGMLLPAIIGFNQDEVISAWNQQDEVKTVYENTLPYDIWPLVPEKKLEETSKLAISIPNQREADIPVKDDDKSIKETSKDSENSLKEVNGVFEKSKIDEITYKRMRGGSWKDNDVISLEDLRYLKMSYWGFDQKEHIGEMVVHKEVADEVLEIFEIVYEGKYPIEEMMLIDEYDANDDQSMEANNSSSFCFRQITGGKSLSKHSYGIAIDINPIMNPYVHGNYIAPASGEDYVDRANKRIGMIYKDDLLYRAFIERGWTWGGDWNTPKDYQHFEKELSSK